MTDQIAVFTNVGERTNVTGSAKFKRLIMEEDYETALDVALNRENKNVIDLLTRAAEGTLSLECKPLRG